MYAAYKLERKEIGLEIKLSKKYKNERIREVIKKILYVSIPISLSSLMASITKNIDSITMVRMLKTFMTEQEAKLQYGI